METVLRITIVYLFLMVGLRFLGKRELGQLSPFDFVTLLLIPEIVAQSLVGEDFSLTNALVGVSTLFVLVFLNSMLNYRFKAMQIINEGTPVVLVRHGQLLHKHMDLERVAVDDIFMEMHKAGIERLAQVKWAILEPDGKISIVTDKPDEAQKPEEPVQL